MKRVKIVEEYNNDDIKNLLKTNKNAVLRAIITLYRYQEQDEKEAHFTMHSNKRGFNSFDAEFLSECAVKILKDGKISDTEFIIARNKMLKYSNQLTNIANSTNDVQMRWSV